MVALVFILVVLVAATHAQPDNNSSLDPKLDMYGLINVLYLKADKDANGMITEPELEDVYHGFDLNQDGQVTKSEFVNLWMQLTHQTKEHAEAYFYLADINDDNIIDEHDLNPLYQVFDLDGDGQVTAQEFATKWVGIIMESPLAVLFERSDKDKNNILSHTEFMGYFSSFDQNADNIINKAEFEHGWTSSNFGLVTEADTLFGKIDSNSDGELTAGDDINAIFTKYDTNHDNQLVILEVVKMVSLLPMPSLSG